MGKCLAWTSIFLLAAAAPAQTAKLSAPKAGEAWALGTTQTISWTWSGSARVKLVLDSQSLGKLGNIKTDLELGAGSFPWAVGVLEKGKSAPAGSDYSIRIVDMDAGKELAAGPVFSIGGGGQQPPKYKVVPIEGFVILMGGKAISVSRPGAGDVWVPLKTYDLKWTWSVKASAIDCKPLWNCNNGCAVDAWLVPDAAPAEKITLVKTVCSSSSYEKGVITYAGSHSGIVPNLASGKYFVRVARSDKADFYGDSPVFTLQSTLSPDTGFVGPDSTQNQVDLALTDVIFDTAGNLAMKVKNLGDAVGVNCDVHFKIFSFGDESKLIRKGEIKSWVQAKPYEEVQLPLTEWGGFTFSTEGWDAGSPGLGIPSKFIPVNSRPFRVEVILTPYNDINPTNNWIKKKMCMIQEADIGTNGWIRLLFTPKNDIYIGSGTTNDMHEDRIQWLAADRFAVTLEVYLWNYGCVARTFDGWLYVDDLPGQKVAAGVTLQPGQRVSWSQPITVRVAERCGNHRLVFIADPPEHKNQPYPNSYQNNFIRGTLKIRCGGTIEGHI